MSANGGPAAPPALTVVDALIIPVTDTPLATDGAFAGWMTVGSDGRITGLGAGQAPPTTGEVLDAGGAIVAPGFVSAHSHLYTSGLRGLAASSGLYAWVRANNEVLAGADPEDMYWFTRHGALDFLGNGVTTAYNFTQSRVIAMYDGATGRAVPVRVNPPDFVVSQIQGAADAGLRVVNSFRLDDEWFEEPESVRTFEAMLRASASCTPPDQHLGTSVMGAVQWSTSSRTAVLEARAMAEHGILNQAHFVETAEGIELQRSKFRWYDEAGALSPSFIFGHFVHPTDEMVARAADTGCAMVWQATSNGRLGSGVADVVRLRAAGIRVGMGLDDQSCTDVSDPFQNMRIGLYAVRAGHRDAGVMTPMDVLRLHTIESARVIGAADRVGSLEVGKAADFVVVDPRRPDTGPVWDVVATYVLACSLRNLKAVYLGGRRVGDADGALAPAAAEAADQLHTRIARIARERGLQLPPTAAG